MIEKCAGTGGVGHQLEINDSDAGESTEASGEEFGEVETGDVFDDHAARLYDLAFEGSELHPDDEIADRAEETSSIAARMCCKDATNCGFAGEGRFDGEELPVLG